MPARPAPCGSAPQLAPDSGVGQQPPDGLILGAAGGAGGRLEGAEVGGCTGETVEERCDVYG